jgi:hypothetical protein
MAGGSPHPASVAQLLDQHRAARGQPPPIAVPVPDDPRLTHLAVTPHALGSYDALTQTDDVDASDQASAPETSPRQPDPTGGSR